MPFSAFSWRKKCRGFKEGLWKQAGGFKASLSVVLLGEWWKCFWCHWMQTERFKVGKKMVSHVKDKKAHHFWTIMTKVLWPLPYTFRAVIFKLSFFSFVFFFFYYGNFIQIITLFIYFTTKKDVWVNSFVSRA